MVDETKLKTQYLLAVVACLALTAIPFLLGFVLFLLTASPDRISSESIDVVTLAVFGLLALSPLVAVPLIRRAAKKSVSAPQQPTAGVESNIMIWTITEYAVWEISSLLGFIGVASGAPITFFVAFMLITLAGCAYSFPRWSRWRALVQELGLASDLNRLTLA